MQGEHDSEKIDAGAEPVSEVDIGIYYHAHLRDFQLPEPREAYHTLISINEIFRKTLDPRRWSG